MSTGEIVAVIGAIITVIGVVCVIAGLIMRGDLSTETGKPKLIVWNKPEQPIIRIKSLTKNKEK